YGRVNRRGRCDDAQRLDPTPQRRSSARVLTSSRRSGSSGGIQFAGRRDGHGPGARHRDKHNPTVSRHPVRRGAGRRSSLAPPQELARWTGVLDATAFGPHCPQVASAYGIPSTTEDCLFLNVFTPGKTNRGRPHLLPVMFWIHGGGLVVGESDGYDP